MKQPPGDMPQEFRSLSEVLQDRVPGLKPPIFLDSGIHQADELHFTLTVKFAYKGAFHVYLAKGNQRTVYTKPVRNSPAGQRFNTVGKVMPFQFYEYKPVGITYEVSKGNFKRWPAAFSKNSYPGRERGKSFSAANTAPIISRAPNSAETKSGKMVFLKQ
jgi:hypothetical protein